MATDAQCELIARSYNALSDILPGFVQRQQQKEMVRRVTTIATRDGLGLIDAPTGTGKSLGYLIPGCVAAITEDKILVVSTATSSLQDQLANKDVPIAIKALTKAGIETSDLKYAVIKGRERHLCPMKLQSLTTEVDMFKDEECELNNIREIWDGGTWNGIRDTIPISISSKSWAKVRNTSATCTKDACSEYDRCPYYEFMALAKESRIIIVNHDYLLTIVANVENHFLCDSVKNIYIFDEAHHLGDKILSSFASSLDFNYSWREDVSRIEKLLGKNYSAFGIAAERMIGTWNAASLATLTMMGDSTIHRFSLGDAPATYNNMLNNLLGSLNNFYDIMDDASKAVFKKAKQS